MVMVIGGVARSPSGGLPRHYFNGRVWAWGCLVGASSSPTHILAAMPEAGSIY